MPDTSAMDTYAQQKRDRRPASGGSDATWFNWTQYPAHGPGAEVLGIGPGASVLDLGCGKGGNLAHISTLGARAVGVDISLAQLRAAKRWGARDGMALRHGSALEFLKGTSEDFDAVYSVFGAVWFSDPGVLLPAIRRRLRRGGVLAFSQRPPIVDCYGCQASYINRRPDQDPVVVRRWDYEPERWREILHEHGFTLMAAQVLRPPPGPREIGTLLVRAAATG
ncbi:class I SAM-dependent methyltransferase [Streptomyces sp. NPDC050738]|uniref:class I SAM-dependent methyltransferase n=1 Tax=Streptomyces sp. NPDC050738 TaxID=3154744 RepID=UPI00341CB06D